MKPQNNQVVAIQEEDSSENDRCEPNFMPTNAMNTIPTIIQPSNLDDDQQIEEKKPEPARPNPLAGLMALRQANAKVDLKKDLQLQSPEAEASGSNISNAQFSSPTSGIVLPPIKAKSNMVGDQQDGIRNKNKSMALGAAFGAGLKGLLAGTGPNQTSPAVINLQAQIADANSRRLTGAAKMQEQLKALINIFGKKKEAASEQTSQFESENNKSKNVLVFESAFKKRLARTRIGNQAANEVILAAMEQDYKAKKEYHKKRRQSMMSRMEEGMLRRLSTIGGTEVNQQSVEDTTIEKAKQGKAEAREAAHQIKARKAACAKFIDHTVTVLFMTLITMYALFFDDIRMILIAKDLDDIFYGITLFGMICFTLEILITSYAKEDYLYSFFFWLDIISTISMIPDCGWIWDPIMGDSGDGAENATDLAKNSRASRAIRVVRIIRLIRLIRIVKLYKQQQIAKQKAVEFKSQLNEVVTVVNQINATRPVDPDDPLDSDDSDFDPDLLNEDSDDEGEFHVPDESKISKTLSARTLKVVVLMVLLLLFILPTVTAGTYIEPTFIHEQGLKQVLATYNQMGVASKAYLTSVDIYLQQTYNSQQDKFPLVYFQAPGIGIREYEPKITALRKEEYNSVSLQADDGALFLATYSMKAHTIVESIINVCRTLFVVVVLSMSSIFFTKDAQELVLDPLERMIEKVKLISKNPLVAASDEVNQAGVMSFYEDQEKKDQHQIEEDEQFETAVLEKAIVKIGHLLALGFGEAGSKIIGQNMKQTGELNALMPGERTYAIFGFCILDDFNETNEVLEETIMSYVNQVAEITHSIVDKYGGSANKNIGEAFVLVWKFHNPAEIEEMDERGEFNNYDICLQNQVIADMSVFSFIKIIAKLNKMSHILKYNNDPIMKTISKDFKVRMGFGLHQGWAIEGAIGSFFKVDASYLSPNVNMAARLEAATKQFGTPLLVSGSLRDLMSTQFQKVLREIDTVTVKGSIKPVRLFTIDLQTNNLIPEEDPLRDLGIRDKKTVRDELRKNLFRRLNCGEVSTWQEISRDSDFIEMRQKVDIKFEYTFSIAYKAYIAGNWQKAGVELKKLIKIRPNDGPCRTLHSIVVDEAKCVVPKDWAGYRPLTRKS